MILQCLYIFGTSVGFCIIFNIRGKNVLIGSLGSVLGWIIYLMFSGLGATDVIQYFLAAFFITIYSEIMAILRKAPATIFLTPSIMPLVPGVAAFRTMMAWLDSDNLEILIQGNYALMVSGAIAMGIILGLTLVKITRVWKKVKTT